MTGEQEKILCKLEIRVRQLIDKCDGLRRENHELKADIAGKNSEIESVTGRNEQLQKQYENLKTARIIEVRQGDFAKAKMKIDDLINKINDCIRLLNE
jgi:FtsZ-binding cell division protein ZapB